MAKILVADDNSNIQKMVGLALKDQGIDVVAVGNGEAAVRKISDVRPDLVLADVFMPVRNGYEVCKYVKGDSSLAHIPVILLVGAFDPLDEEEAQRVGADGVLKKPFVPPDPLISMVKSALVRASTGATAKMAPAPTPASTTATVKSLDASVPTVPGIPNEAVPEPEAFVDEVPPKPAELKIETGGQPLAFNSLLETPTAEKSPEDSAVFVTPNPVLPERDWSAGEEEEIQEEDEEDPSVWHPDGGVEAFDKSAAASGEKPAKQKREQWTPTREKTQDLLESATEPEFVTEAPAPKTASTGGWPVSPAIATPPAHAEGSNPVAPASKPAIVEAKPAVEPKKPVVAQPSALKPAAAPPVPAPLSTPPRGEAAAKETGKPGATDKPVAVEKAAQPDRPAQAGKPDTGGSWFSISSTPWEAEAKPSSQAPAWDARPADGASPSISTQPIELSSPVVSEPVSPVQHQGAAPGITEIEQEPVPTGFYTGLAPLPELVGGGETISPEAVEALRQEATQVIEESKESTLKHAKESAPEHRGKAPEPAAVPADVDALVAKVLAKLSPDVLQAVTREILKPVVEAVVRDEIKTKK